MASTSVCLAGVTHAYGERQALQGIDLEVAGGCRWALLGPNGSGKSTLFKLLATILPLQGGSATVCGLDLTREQAAVRRKLGVVFQSPALDRQLTVLENLRYGGLLYGLSGQHLANRIHAVLIATGLSDRRGDPVGELSGGLKRRVEIAKALLHEPELLLLDEPSTGLDPAARRELWDLVAEPEGTVLFTTHLMEEAAQADHVTLLDQGRIVAQGTPVELTEALGDEVLEVECGEARLLEDGTLMADVARVTGLDAKVEDGVLRVRGAAMHKQVGPVVEALGERAARVSVRRPTLEDVFLKETGRGLGGEEPTEPAAKGRRGRRRR